MNLFTIPAGIPFLDALATWWLGRSEDPLVQADGLFLMPTRRAARGLTAAFLRVANGRPLLLPRIGAIGAPDEAPLALSGALDLPPAIGDAERLATLTRLVMAQGGAGQTADRAWPLAEELARLLDEAYREGVDLAATLPRLVPEDYAAHWGRTLEFLQIVTRHWPTWLQDTGRIDATDRAVRLIQAQAAVWEEAPPNHPVIIAGTAAGTTATARLMRAVARMPGGAVVLPGLDRTMAEDAWEALDAGHAQAGLRDLLAGMGAVRADVALWPGVPDAPDRAGLIARSLLPAEALADWRGAPPPPVSGLERLDATDAQEEAVAIALLLRDALETPHAQAALVTPDRGLAARVAAELTRFGVVVDDSAGEPLDQTPPGVFLILLAEAVAAGLAPVALLSVLKHPFSALGLAPAECRRRARTLERLVLRGPAPPPGLAGLRAALGAKAQPALDDLVDRMAAALAPLLALGEDAAPDSALRALIAAAEAFAARPDREGAGMLWALEEGEALAEHLAGLAGALPVLPVQPLRILPGLLRASMAGVSVRTRRALRGREGFEHPRIAILGLLEARLQSFDMLVLGGLAEGVWPAATDPGPWMSRPMRVQAGLASPETVVGQMAHDYAMLSCAAPRVILSCPRRRDGAPAVPSRWLVRLEAFLTGHRMALPACAAAGWARLLDQPDGAPLPVPPPRPLPPAAVRPRQLAVTDIETWLRDPYALYARRILRLRVLDPLEQPVENADFGALVHAAIARWVGALPPMTYPPDAARHLRAAMEAELATRPLRPALAAWWRPRLMRIADWVAEIEADRHKVARQAAVEVSGRWDLPGIAFTLTGRADRIERLADGTLALLDYKTGIVPTDKEVAAGLAPQLPLEAAMAEAGAFGPELTGKANEAAYWKLSGGPVPGEEKPIKDLMTRTQEAATSLVALVRQFDDPAQPYLSHPHPETAPRFADYAHLARVAEWSAAEDGE